jgi:DMSO reductase anchor subunit
MSLCSTCGLDLDTGARIDLAEEIEAVAGPRRSVAPPIGVVIVGGLSISTAVIFSIISLLQWQKGETGYIFLLLVCLFGIGAAVQFLRSKTTRLLLVALTLGAMIDVVAMMVLPVYDAVTQVDTRDQSPDPDDVDASDVAIVSMSERLDTNRLAWGIAILVCYAAVSVYLNSPPVKRHFRR